MHACILVLPANDTLREGGQSWQCKVPLLKYPGGQVEHVEVPPILHDIHRSVKKKEI
jgi:hypothetical protein